MNLINNSQQKTKKKRIPLSKMRHLRNNNGVLLINMYFRSRASVHVRLKSDYRFRKYGCTGFRQNAGHKYGRSINKRLQSIKFKYIRKHL